MASEADLKTVKVPKVLIDGVKSMYNLEQSTNRYLITCLLLSNLTIDKVEIILDNVDLNISIEDVKKFKKQMSKSLANESNDKTKNKQILKNQKEILDTNHMILAMLKLNMKDNAYSFPEGDENIKGILNQFQSTEQSINNILGNKEGK